MRGHENKRDGGKKCKERPGIWEGRGYRMKREKCKEKKGGNKRRDTKEKREIYERRRARIGVKQRKDGHN